MPPQPPLHLAFMGQGDLLEHYRTLFNLRVPVSEDHHLWEHYSSAMGHDVTPWLSNPSTILPYLYGPTQTEYAVYAAELRRRGELAAAAQTPHSLGVVQRRDGRAARREEEALAHEGMGLSAGLMYWGRRY